jgi:hypothetical protein
MLRITISNKHAITISPDSIKILLNQTRRESNLKPNLKDNSTHKEKSSLVSLRLRKVKLNNTKSKLMLLITSELKRMKNSNRRSENTKKLPLSSQKLEDSSQTTSKHQKEKNSSKEEVDTVRTVFTQMLKSVLKLLPSSKSISNNTQREPLNSPTERHTASSSRPSPPSHPRLNN